MLISTSMRGSLAAIASPTLRVSAMLERSARCTRWPSPGAFASSLRIVACARASSRAMKTIRAPSPASATTATSPMPEVAPVATMVLPCIEWIPQPLASSLRHLRSLTRRQKGTPDHMPATRAPARPVNPRNPLASRGVPGRSTGARPPRKARGCVRRGSTPQPPRPRRSSSPRSRRLRRPARRPDRADR